jgi:hypothetical protein
MTSPGTGIGAFQAPSGVSAPDVGTIDPTAAAAKTGGSVFDTGASPVAGLSGTTGAPSAASGAGSAASGAASGGGGIGSSIMNTLTKNPLQTAGLGLAGLSAASSLMNKNNVPGQAQVGAINATLPQLQGLVSNVNQEVAKLQSSTAPLDANTLQMLSYVNNGQLPPAMQAQIDNGVQAAKAQAASDMAAKGLPADPTNNPQLASQYATIDSQALAMKGQLETQLYQAGLQAWQASNQTEQTAGQLQQNALQATGLDLNTYMQLQQIYQNQSNQEQQAIGNLAQALGKMGSGGGTTIQIGK